MAVEKEESMSIDEIVVPFKGRFNMKQYVRNKPHKWGVNIFALAGVSGFVYDFQIYTGKGTVPAGRNSIGIIGDIVLHLARTMLKHLNYKVYFDNWFSSHHLLLHLKECGYLACGTVRSNRLDGCNLMNDKQTNKN